jgi:hypothetical protein
MSGVPRNQFGDPASGAVYAWHTNHNAEELGSEECALEEIPPALTGWQQEKTTVQQGSRQPLTLRLAGTILNPVQHQQFLHFTALSQRHSVFFYCFDGTSYEVLINKYTPTRKFAINAPRGSHYIWTYTLEMEIITTI